MSNRPASRPRPTRHLFLVSAQTADEVAANSGPSADDVTDLSWTLQLDSPDTAATTARLYITEILNRWNLAVPADPAALVVTELVSEAARHAKPPLVLTIRMDKATRPPELEISVAHDDSSLPGDHKPSEHGRFDLLTTHGLADLSTTVRDKERALTARIPCTNCA